MWNSTKDAPPNDNRVVVMKYPDGNGSFRYTLAYYWRAPDSPGGLTAEPHWRSMPQDERFTQPTTSSDFAWKDIESGGVPQPPGVQLRLSRAAVDALFDKDPTLCTQLGHQVIEHVVKTRFLKCIESDPTLRKLTDIVLEEMRIHAVKTVGATCERMYGRDIYKLGPELSAHIEAAAKSLILGQIDSIVETRLANINVDIKRRVDALLDEAVKTHTRERVNAAVADALAKIKA